MSDNASKLVAGALCAIVLLACAWAEHRWGASTTLLGRIEDAAFGILVSLGVYHAATASARRDAGKGGGQAGRTLWFFPLVLALIAIAACMSGCTTTTASLYKGYTSEAVAGVKMWDDNTLATVRTVLCAQPYSAIQRHPELQPGVQALCGPLANSSSLDANQLQLLVNVLGASGIKLQSAPTK